MLQHRNQLSWTSALAPRLLLSWWVRKGRGNCDFLVELIYFFFFLKTKVQEIPLMFAMWPGHVFKEPLQSKQLSITFKHNFRAPAPATPVAKHSMQCPRANGALGEQSLWACVSTSIPSSAFLLTPLNNKYQLISFMRAKWRSHWHPDLCLDDFKLQLVTYVTNVIFCSY